MKFLPHYLALFYTIPPCQTHSEKASAEIITPVAKRLADTFHEYGNTRIDYFNWLSNTEDSSVISDIEKENAFTNHFLQHTKGTQQQIYEELTGRLDSGESSLPTKSNGYWYYNRYEDGKQYPLPG